MTQAPPAPSGEIPGARRVFALAWPMTLKAIMLHGIVVIDTFLVATLGESALAAMGLAGAIAGLMLGVVGAFSMATQIRVAQAFGSGRGVALKTAFWCGMILNLAIAGLGVLGVALFGDAITAQFAHSPAIAQEAQRYLGVFLFVVLAEALALSLSSHFNGCGETRAPFYGYLVSVPVNVAVSVVLIHGLLGAPALGVMGAAIGTAVGSVLRLAYLAQKFRSAYAGFAGVAGWLNGGLARALWRHMAFALPIAATFVSSTLAMSVCTLIYASMSVRDFAAFTLIMPWVMVAGTVGMSWAQATGIVVAQMLGRADPVARLDAFLTGAWRVAFLAAAVVSAVYGAVCLLAPHVYAGLHAETKATLLGFLPVLLLLPFPKGSNAICGNTLRAGGETVFVMHVFLWSQWLFRVPATAAMVLWLELPATWVFSLLLLDELVKFPAFHARMWRGDWKRAPVEGAE